ncbi:uncharacterized protein LOC101731022 isoform X2 [Xenopus tropicalis]|uniref:ribonuclease H n=1 Tax=Xenopus tropicalis TaxID=8364 RepID=A0A8J1J4N1_XENTR|nr:uncharacterized protein LOC101731022 isoform X2 [Xenopus tropicalis]
MELAIQEFKEMKVLIQVPQKEKFSGVYSPIFLVPKPNGEYRTIIDLRYLNQFIFKKKFKMESIRSTLLALRKGDVMCTLDLKDAYLHIPIRKCHQKFLRVAIKGPAGTEHLQFTALPFGISSTPRVFTKVMVVVAAYLRTQGIAIIPYLDDCLLKAETDLVLQRNLFKTIEVFSVIGLVNKLGKIQSKSCKRDKIFGNGVEHTRRKNFPPSRKKVKNQRQSAQVSKQEILFNKARSRNLGSFFSSIRSSSMGTCPYERSAKIYKLSLGSSKGIAQKETLCSTGNKEISQLVVTPKEPFKRFSPISSSSPSHHNRRKWQRLGSTFRKSGRAGKLGKRYCSSGSKLLRVGSSMESPACLQNYCKRPKCSNTYRQCGNSLLHKSPRRFQKQRPGNESQKDHVLGRKKSKKYTSTPYFGAQQYQSRLFKSQVDTSRRVEFRSRNISSDLQGLGFSSNRPHGLKVQCKASKILFPYSRPRRGSSGCTSPIMGFQPSIYLSTYPYVSKSDQESCTLLNRSDSNSSCLAQKELVLQPPPTFCQSSLATSSEGKSLTPGTNFSSKPCSSSAHSMETERDVMRAQGISAPVIEVLLQSRKEITNKIYQRIWSRFRKWCSDKKLTPEDVPVSIILDFLHDGFRKKLAPNTLKVHIAAISAFKNISLAEHPLIKRFVKAVQNIRPKTNNLTSNWDLDIVLRALQNVPFEPLEEASLYHLSIKTVFLVAVCSARRIGELQALSCKDSCLQVFPDRVILKADPLFRPKVSSNFHRNFEVILPVFFAEPKNKVEEKLHLLDARRCVLFYLNKPILLQGNQYLQTSRLILPEQCQPHRQKLEACQWTRYVEQLRGQVSEHLQSITD